MLDSRSWQTVLQGSPPLDPVQLEAHRRVYMRWVRMEPAQLARCDFGAMYAAEEARLRSRAEPGVAFPVPVVEAEAVADAPWLREGLVILFSMAALVALACVVWGRAQP